jgi:stage V sporulation protein S
VTQLKVSARSNPNAVAGAVAGVVREHGRAEVHVIGAGALNQAIKAVAIARGYLADQGIDLVCVPSFVTLDVDGEQRTAISLMVEDRGPTIRLDEPIVAVQGASATP